jgi:hypothetical protein
MEHDGLTNVEEMNYGSNPLKCDSDYDSLSDYEEINEYNTNPTLYDTDDDGLNDKDEITLGFDPKNPDTNGNGILDGDEKTHQTISYKIDCKEKPEITNVQINMDCTEVIDKTTTIQPMYDIDVYTSDLVGLVGSPVEIETTSKFDVAEVIFTYNPDNLNGVSEDNLCVMWYDTDNGIFELVNSVVDKNNHTVMFTTTHFSEWVLCNEEEYNKAINDIPDYTSIDLSGNFDWNGTVVNTKELSEIVGYRESDIVAISKSKAMYVLKADVTYNLKSGISFTNKHYFYSSQPMNGENLCYVDKGKRACIAPKNWYYTTYTYTTDGSYDFGLDTYGEKIGLPRL